MSSGIGYIAIVTRIALLSDTHGYLDPKVHDHLEGCDEVWHAGDVGDPAILDGLSGFYKLRAVHGNIDGARIRSLAPQDQHFTLEGVKVWMTHIGGRPGKYEARVLKGFETERPDIFICGHSHICKVEYDQQEELLYLNPGAAGREGFHKVRTLLRFSLEKGRPKDMEVVELGPRSRG